MAKTANKGKWGENVSEVSQNIAWWWSWEINYYLINVPLTCLGHTNAKCKISSFQNVRDVIWNIENPRHFLDANHGTKFNGNTNDTQLLKYFSFEFFPLARLPKLIHVHKFPLHSYYWACARWLHCEGISSSCIPARHDPVHWSEGQFLFWRETRYLLQWNHGDPAHWFFTENMQVVIFIIFYSSVQCLNVMETEKLPSPMLRR